MGTNPTQAKAVGLFFVAFTLIALALAAGGNAAAMLAGLASLAWAVALFVKCKPWEHREE